MSDCSCFRLTAQVEVVGVMDGMNVFVGGRPKLPMGPKTALCLLPCPGSIISSLIISYLVSNVSYFTLQDVIYGIKKT